MVQFLDYLLGNSILDTALPNLAALYSIKRTVFNISTFKEFCLPYHRRCDSFIADFNISLQWIFNDGPFDYLASALCDPEPLTCARPLLIRERWIVSAIDFCASNRPPWHSLPLCNIWALHFCVYLCWPCINGWAHLCCQPLVRALCSLCLCQVDGLKTEFKQGFLDDESFICIYVHRCIPIHNKQAY